jgi:hypothetical protein
MFNLCGFVTSSACQCKVKLKNLVNCWYAPVCSVGSFECLSEEILLPERVTRISTCETEADAMAADIINRTAVSGIYYSNSVMPWNVKELLAPRLSITP